MLPSHFISTFSFTDRAKHPTLLWKPAHLTSS
jgi:hypothetical protein